MLRDAAISFRLISCVVLAVSPLASLMVEQVRSLHKRGVSAAILSGDQGIDECLLANEKDFEEGKLSLLFSAPESVIGSNRQTAMLLKPSLRKCVVAVDQARCVSKQ